MNKTTFENYKKLPLKSFLFTANLVFALDCYAVYFNSISRILSLQTPLIKGVLLRNCLDKIFFLKEKLLISRQNACLFLGKKSIVFCLIAEIKNLRKVHYCQNRPVFGIDEIIVSFI